ncbi:heparinase II/III-like protein [Kribbella sp. VKM Ac-2569]|uniref:heparinase II/III family protein n=1 Tax=Kribbella sp. VKM Ac-2569 TaxID=2512220 RepID=UPI00102B728F|nr:heparinase II/III family protein [Kribbella sp. VKM Ac-2569]RZT28199.1 heparinase II/III-like protein [Kribbella sp. VKM Ac-2569]
MRTSLRATVVAAATALMVLAGTLGARDASTAEDLSDAEFFGLLDYGVAGLRQVQAAVQKGDYAAAKSELLAYYRARPANDAGKFTHKDWPGVLALTPDHIWTLGSGETYLTTARFGTQEAAVSADVTSAITSGTTGFLLMARIKDPVTVVVNSREKASGKPALRLTLDDGSVRTLNPTADTYIKAGADAGTTYGAKDHLQVRDQGAGPFTAETRKAFLQFDLTGVSGVRSAALTLTGRADAAKDVMVFSNSEAFVESTRTWNNTVQNTYSWQGDPGGFDWRLPTGADKEYWYQLARFFFAGPLATAYQKTTDEKYADALIGTMTDFISDADGYGDAGSYPRSLDTARRLDNWTAAYEILRSSPSLDAEENVEILKTMYRSGLHLQGNVHDSPNWMQTQKISLLHAAVYLPEFTAAAGWRTSAADFLAGQLNDSTYADGGYREATSGYARGYVSQYVDLVEFMKKHGIAFTATEKLRKLGHFLMDQTLPNGYTANYGDSGSDDQRSVLRRLGELLGDQELIYVGTSGKAGTKPQHVAARYPDTRVAVSRSGWSAADSYLRYNIDRGPHSHPDELSLVTYAHGRELLVDPGAYSYSSDPRSDWLRKTTEAHNTVEVDNLPQNNTAAGEITHFVSNPAFDLISGNTDASAGAWHARSVLTLRSGMSLVSDQLKPRDTATHRYEQNWHFLPDANPVQTATSKAAVTKFASGANLAVVPADPEKLTASVRNGYYSPAFYHVSDAKYASYVKQGKGKTTFDTLLLPSPAAADGAVRINRLAVGTLTPDLATALDIRYGDGGRGTYYKSWASKATRSFGSYSFDGKMLYAEDRSLVLYDGSKVTRAGKVLLSSPVAVNDVAVSYAGSTLRIDGRGLTASTDPAKAIGIAAPNTTEVLLNGARVDFSRTGDLVYAAATP